MCKGKVQKQSAKRSGQDCVTLVEVEHQWPSSMVRLSGQSAVGGPQLQTKCIVNYNLYYTISTIQYYNAIQCNSGPLQSNATKLFCNAMYSNATIQCNETYCNAIYSNSTMQCNGMEEIVKTCNVLQ